MTAMSRLPSLGGALTQWRPYWKASEATIAAFAFFLLEPSARTWDQRV
jgi:hypothetical protein